MALGTRDVSPLVVVLGVLDEHTVLIPCHVVGLAWVPVAVVKRERVGLTTPGERVLLVHVVSIGPQSEVSGQ